MPSGALPELKRPLPPVADAFPLFCGWQRFIVAGPQILKTNGMAVLAAVVLAVVVWLVLSATAAFSLKVREPDANDCPSSRIRWAPPAGWSFATGHLRADSLQMYEADVRTVGCNRFAT